MAVRSKGSLDAGALQSIADTVRDWASYQKLAGDLDIVETSTIVGTYDWKAYLQEETQLAQARDEREQSRKPTKKPSAQVASAPTHWYV